MIVKYPSTILDQPSVSALDYLTKEQIDDLCVKMREECWKVNGLGISAIQIGEPYKIFGIINPNKKDLMWLIDPEIRRASGNVVYKEGCLSIPGYFWEVKRPSKVSVSFYNSSGMRNYRTFTGVHARVIQHEMDHLDGLLIPDLMDDDKVEDFQKFFESNRPVYEYNPPKISLI